MSDTDNELGMSRQEALAASRMIGPATAPAFLNVKGGAEKKYNEYAT